MDCLCVVAEQEDCRRVTNVQSIAQCCMFQLSSFKIEVKDAILIAEAFVHCVQVEVESELKRLDLKVLDCYMYRAQVLLVHCIDIDASSNKRHCYLTALPLKIAHQYVNGIVAFTIAGFNVKFEPFVSCDREQEPCQG